MLDNIFHTSDRYHGLHRRVMAKSCQCRTVGEVSGPVLNHEHSYISGTSTGPDSHVSISLMSSYNCLAYN